MNGNVIDMVEGLTLEQAVEKYEPMVHHFVNSAFTNYVCNKEDLIQEGKLAIVVAFKNFDPEKGASLTTWTYHMVRDAILEYQKHHLSILSGGHHLLSILKKAGEDASVEEIMDFGVSYQTAVAATYIKGSTVTTEYNDIAALIGAEDVESNLLNAIDYKAHLDANEAYTIFHFFGFDGQRMSLKEIGEVLGKSQRAVSYMLNKALNKLRRIPGIEDYATM